MNINTCNHGFSKDNEEEGMGREQETEREGGRVLDKDNEVVIKNQ